jgi:hypothetical protein
MLAAHRRASHRFRPKRSFAALVCLAITATMAPAARAAHVSVSGTGALTNEGLHLAIDANANSNHPTQASGTFHAFRADVPFDNFDISGPISCLRVVGNTAFAGGQITSGGDSFVYFEIIANQQPSLQQVIIAFIDGDLARNCTFEPPETLPWDVGNFAVSRQGGGRDD